MQNYIRLKTANLMTELAFPSRNPVLSTVVIAWPLPSASCLSIFISLHVTSGSPPVGLDFSGYTPGQSANGGGGGEGASIICGVFEL